MLNKRYVILLALMIYSSNFCFADAAPPEKYLSLRDAIPEDRLLDGLLPSLVDIISGLLDLLGLDFLADLLETIRATGLLKSASDLVQAILSLPVMIGTDPVAAFESLFENLQEVIFSVQQLAVGRLTCTACWFLIGLFKFLLLLEYGDDFIANAAIGICITFQIYPERVCKGVVEAQK